MPVDVRINNVNMDMNVTDASGLLTPQMLERIVQAVLRRLEEQRRGERVQRQETALGDEHRHGVIADLHDIRRIPGSDLGEQAGVIVRAGYRFELYQDIGIGLFKGGDDFLVRVQALAAIAGAHAQDDLGALGLGLGGGSDHDLFDDLNLHRFFHGHFHRLLDGDHFGRRCGARGATGDQACRQRQGYKDGYDTQLFFNGLLLLLK